MFWRPRKSREQDLDREIRSYLEAEATEQRDNGLSPDEARYAAQRAFGNTTLMKEEVREVWGWIWIERFGQDLRFALRTLRKSPGFVSVAIFVLALGTGANTAIFSVFHAVVLRPLPFKDSERVTLLFETIPKRGVHRSDLCAANFYDLQRRSRSFSTMAILSGSGFTLTDNSSPEQISGALVSASFFSVLGVPPHLGRAFRAQDEDPGAPGVVILGDQLWQRRFGGDPAILGKTILLNGRAHQVVGIMPERFQALFRDHELWVPMQLTPEERADRKSHFSAGRGPAQTGCIAAAGTSRARQHWQCPPVRASIC